MGGIVTMLLLLALLLSLGKEEQHRHQHIAPRAAGRGLGTAPRLADAPKWLPNDLAGLPPYLAPAPAGSSPKQRRPGQKAQAQNLARAGVQPTTVKIKKSSVATASGATAVNRPASAVTTAAGSGGHLCPQGWPAQRGLSGRPRGGGHA
jgi:hypothetical protein